ncbi:hypothetical protein FJZ28_04090 [Candidatus Peregrinibacteria bacterium]|nr:hypothetical protein [Candidatus Peregrinibacteria bacterium]
MESSSHFHTLTEEPVQGGTIRLEAVSGLGPGPFYPAMAIPEAWAYFRRLAVDATTASHLDSLMVTSALLNPNMKKPQTMHADARRMISEWVSKQRADLRRVLQEEWAGMTLEDIRKTSACEELPMRQVHANIGNCFNSVRWKILRHSDLQIILDAVSLSSSHGPLLFPEPNSHHPSRVSRAQ